MTGHAIEQKLDAYGLRKPEPIKDFVIVEPEPGTGWIDLLTKLLGAILELLK